MRNAKHYNASATTPEYMLEPHVAEQVRRPLQHTHTMLQHTQRANNASGSSLPQIFTTMLTEAGVDIVANQTVASVQTR